MRTITLMVISVAFLLSTMACSKQIENESESSAIGHNEQSVEVIELEDVRESIWNQLSTEQKEWIDGTWTDGEVSKIILTEKMMTQVVDKSYQGKEVYMIDFPTKVQFIPNNMIVFADVDTFEYIGNGIVD